MIILEAINHFRVKVYAIVELHLSNINGKRKNGNFKRKHKTVLCLFDLNILLNYGRHQMLSKLASLSISTLRKLDYEANKFYDIKHDLSEGLRFVIAALPGLFSYLFCGVRGGGGWLQERYVCGLARRGSTIGFHLLWHTLE